MYEVNPLNGDRYICQNHWTMNKGQCNRRLHGFSVATTFIGTCYMTSFNSNLIAIIKQGVSKILPSDLRFDIRWPSFSFC